MNSYASIAQVGSNAHSEVNNPLTYCMNNTMDQRFLHGGHADTYGQHSRPCQLFMSEYCAKKWDNFCEVASANKTTWLPNSMDCSTGISARGAGKRLTAGETLIRNTAARKYLIQMLNAHKKYMPFDPTVPTSPLISYWRSNADVTQADCGSVAIPMFAVDPTTIDNDPVMDKLLLVPAIAPDILINIYNTMKRQGVLGRLKGTKLGKFYSTVDYFKNKGGLS
jgi:hypothetical protein